METINVQPLALVHNNEVVYIEGNTANVQKKFASFKIVKLKGPIDVNYLQNNIFPSSERDHYNLEVSDYDGKSAKIKINFTNGTHKDLVQHLQNSAGKFFNISENGLVDWLASDTVTFKTIYQSTDRAASQQLRLNKVLSSTTLKDSTSTDSTSTGSTSKDSTSKDSTSEDSTSKDSTSKDTTSKDLNLCPIIDEEAIERELNELSQKVASKTTLKNYELERLFHNTFQRRDMTVTITDLSDIYFSQIRNVVAFVGNDTPNTIIEDTFMMDSNTIVHNFARLLYKYAETYINSGGHGLVMGFVKNYKFGIILTLWNLINVMHSVNQSYQVLINSGDEFKKIFQSQKSDFINYLSIVDKTLMDLLVILYDEIDEEKYERLQRRLEHFVKSAEDLLKLVMIINDECDKEIVKLENQKKDLSTRIYNAAITIGITAVVIGGYMYTTNNKKSENKSHKDNEGYDKLIGKAAFWMSTTASGYVMYDAYSTKSKLQNSIQKHTTVLEQLQSAYKELKSWKILGKKYIQKDIDDMNNNRMTLIDEFVRIRSQCKCLGDIFNSLDEDKK